MAAPKMKGQDKDYLVMALRAYRDDKRESSTMHRMLSPYSNAIIESSRLMVCQSAGEVGTIRRDSNRAPTVER